MKGLVRIDKPIPDLLIDPTRDGLSGRKSSREVEAGKRWKTLLGNKHTWALWRYFNNHTWATAK